MSEFWGEENPKRHLFFSRFFIQVPAQSHGKQETVKSLWIFFFWFTFIRRSHYIVFSEDVSPWQPRIQSFEKTNVSFYYGLTLNSFCF